VLWPQCVDDERSQHGGSARPRRALPYVGHCPSQWPELHSPAQRRAYPRLRRDQGALLCAICACPAVGLAMLLHSHTAVRMFSATEGSHTSARATLAACAGHISDPPQQALRSRMGQPRPPQPQRGRSALVGLRRRRDRLDARSDRARSLEGRASPSSVSDPAGAGPPPPPPPSAGAVHEPDPDTDRGAPALLCLYFSPIAGLLAHRSCMLGLLRWCLRCTVPACCCRGAAVAACKRSCELCAHH